MKSLTDALVLALKIFYKLHYPKTMGDSEFLQIYKLHYEVIKQSGGCIGNHSGLLAVQFLKMKMDVTVAADIAAHLEEASNKAKEDFLVSHFLWMLN